MKPIKIRGFACPYDQLNSYREGMKPGAFDKQLKDLHGLPLPMGFMHQDPCGVWTKLSADEKGLWCEGIITSPNVAELVEHGALNELSITFRAPDENGKHVVTKQRAAPLLQRGLKPPADVKLVDESWTKDAELVEISLVDRGAFKGTHFQLVGA